MKKKWRRIVGWALGIIAGLLIIIGLGGYLFLRSSAFNQFALRKIVEAAHEATGAPTTIRGLDFSLSSLTAHLYGITIHGKESGGGEAPLLTIDKLTVGLKIDSALQRKVSLSDLIVDHPVAHIRVDGSGNSNLPSAPRKQASSQTSVFDLAVRHAQLTRGELTYNDRTIPLNADLYNLGADIRFDRSATRYSGFISYDRGQLHYGDYSALPHKFHANFSATPDKFSIEPAVIKVGSSVASVRAALNNYSNPAVAGEYDIRLNAQDFSSFAPASRPAGEVSLVGQIRYQETANRSMLRDLVIDGQIASEALAASAAGGRVSIGKLRGNYQLADGTLHASDVEFESFGGRLTGDITFRNLDTTASGRVRASLRTLSLPAMQRSFPQEVKQVALAGSLNGTVDASWTGSVSQVRIQSDWTLVAAAKNPSLPLSSSANSAGSSSTRLVPVEGAIHVLYDGRHNALFFRQSTLRVPSATLTADGELSHRSNLRVQATANDLHELESLTEAFRNKSSALPPVSGSATLNANMHGSLKKPEISGQLSAQNLSVQGSEWKNAEASLQASPSQFVVTNGSLASAHRGRAMFSATVSLRDWQYLPSNSLKASLSVQQMSVAELQRLANMRYPVTGDLSADISLNGTQLEPEGSGKIQIAHAGAYGEPIESFEAQFHTDRGTIVSRLHVAVAAGSANADVSFTPKTKAYKVRLDAPSVVLQKLHTLQAKNLGLSGTVMVSANGEGTIDDPKLSAFVELPQLNIRDKSISNSEAELQVANHTADIRLDSNAVNASVQARAHLNLTGDYYAEVSIETSTVPLNVLLATYLATVPDGFQGEAEIHATMKGPLKDKTRLEAHLTIPRLEATYQSLQIGIAAPVHADFANSVLTVQPAEIRGTGTSLRMQGSIPVAGNATPTLTAEGSLDMRVAKIFLPDLRSAGTVSFSVHASGSAQDPNINGQLRLQDVALLYAGAPLGLEKLNGTLDIGKESIQISKLTGQVGGGEISAGGSIVYRPNLQFNVALQSKAVRLRYPDGLRTLLDTNLTLAGNKDSSTLSGRVLIDSLAFTSDFDLSNFADQVSNSSAVPVQPGLADTVNLAIKVQSADNLSANSSQISLEGRANLQVAGTAANPIITGRTDLTAGELFYRNVRYQLQRGIITFDDPNHTNPVLNVSASTTVEQYNLTLNLRGPFDKLTTSYTSDPPLSTADVINLIARGKTTQESAASSQSTDSMIASQAASQFSGNVQKLAGISSLQIDPLIGGNNSNPSARIAVQQRVTKNFLFTFSTDVSQPGSEVVQGDYQINKRWSVSATRDQLGGVSVDGRLHTRF